MKVLSADEEPMCLSWIEDSTLGGNDVLPAHEGPVTSLLVIQRKNDCSVYIVVSGGTDGAVIFW